MNLFIAWSGERSKQVALAFRDMLRKVIQIIEPFMSEEDIEKGSRWSDVLAQQLQENDSGLVCLSPENLTKPWLNFEAGALSKSVEKARLYTYLYDLKQSDVTGPLSQFQATLATKEETQKLLTNLNNKTSKPIGSSTLDELFNKCWPGLDAAIKAIPPTTTSSPKTSRDQKDILDEVLVNTRTLVKDLPAIARQLKQIMPSRGLLSSPPLPSGGLFPLPPLPSEGTLPPPEVTLEEVSKFISSLKSGKPLLSLEPSKPEGSDAGKNIRSAEDDPK